MSGIRPGWRVRTTEGWADRYNNGVQLTGIVRQVADPSTLPGSPLERSRNVKVHLDRPWGAGQWHRVRFDPADLEALP